jgi:hypothetical protein
MIQQILPKMTNRDPRIGRRSLGRRRAVEVLEVAVP